MPRPAFDRACRLKSTAMGWLILLLSVCSAVLLPLMILDLGLIVQLLVTRESNQLAHDWVLGPWVSGRIAAWPWFGSYELCLLALVACGGAFAILRAVLQILLEGTTHRHALRVATRLRQEIRGQAFRLGTHDLLGTANARPEGLITSTMDQLRRGLVSWWRTIPSSWVELGVLVLLAVAVNFWLTLLAVVLAVVIASSHNITRSRCEATADYWKQRQLLLAERLGQNLATVATSVGYGLAELPGARFEQLLEQMKRTELRVNTSKVVVKPGLLLTILLAVGFLLLVVGLRDDATIAGTVVLGAALIAAYFPAARLYRLSQELNDADRAASAIFQYLDRETGLAELPQAKPIERVRRQITLDAVTLGDRHGGRLLDEVSLCIPAGERVAVLASDPETPRALAGLFVRFYDPAAGRVLYDNQDICHARLDTIRGQALLVSGSEPLFPGTILENITCGDSGFTTLQITDAAKQAEAYDFIQQLPAGFSSVLGEDGVSLSGDQSFRISLARALLREPSLLVIEEPASQLEEPVMHQLERAIEQASRGRTVVLLPAMILTLRSADRVFLLHEGRLEAEGTHAELVQSNELYRHINYLRFNILRNQVKW